MELEFRNSRNEEISRQRNVAKKLVLQANLQLWKNCPIAYPLRVVQRSQSSLNAAWPASGQLQKMGKCDRLSCSMDRPYKTIAIFDASYVSPSITENH